MAGDITFTGLASGIPFDDMLAKLTEVNKYQIKKLESWKQEWQDKIDVFNLIDSTMSKVDTAISPLRTSKDFYSKKSSSSSTTVATVAVDSTANPGSYNLDIPTSTKEIIGGTGWADTDTTAIASASGTFSFDDGDGKTISVAVDSSTTLDDLNTLIQNEITNQGSTAQVAIENDSSSSNPYRLKITAATAGASNNITINQDDTNLSFSANTIDSIENTKWSGTSTVTSGGTYTGYVNKRLNFSVLSGGTVGTDDIELKWEDPVEKTSGTITIDNTGTFSVNQGVTLDVGSGTMTKDDTFSIDLFTPTIQQAQDSGLAKSEKEVHAGFSDEDTSSITSVDGTFSYSFAGNAIPALQISAGSTLKDLKDAINSDSNNPGVEASIINDGTGNANAFHLVLTSKKSGAAFKIENISHTLDNFSSSFSEVQKGTNSMMKLNDYPLDDEYIQNTSNLVSDLIPGASITLQSEGTTNISISNDIDAMTQKVQDFVDAYNDAWDYLTEITKVSLNSNDEADTSKSGILVGNYGVNMLKSEMQLFMVKPAEGFEDGVEPYTLLKQLGLSIGDGGKLEFDTSVFQKEIQDNPDSVVELFADNKAGTSSNNFIKYKSGMDTTTAGKYDVEVNFDSSGNVTTARYKNADDSTWYDFDVAAGNILTALDGDGKGMALDAIWDGSSTQETSTVRVKMGKANEYYYRMRDVLSPTSGITKVLENNYEDIIKNIDKKIVKETARVKMEEEIMRKKFTNAEIAIQQANSQQQSLTSSIAQLPSGM